jgi:dienelactone hydrolase
MPEPTKPDIGIYYDMLKSIAPKEPSLSYLAKEWPNVDTWRTEARGKVIELLNFSPKDTPLNSSVDSRTEEDGLVSEEISYDMPYGPRTRGTFLYPKDHKGRLPAVLSLHDHGGFFYFGKDKNVECHSSSKLLEEHKRLHYGGKSWANEVAKRGFAVLSVDSFMWGSRKVPVESVNPALTAPLAGLEDGTDSYIQAYNDLADGLVSHFATNSLVHAGVPWEGPLFYEDQRSLDYLVSRAEVDPARMACGGLSGGGLRTVFLAGLDPRIKAGFAVGWMSTLGSMYRNHIRGHGLVMYVPQLSALLDIPDVIALHGPAPLMVQYDKEDGLFSLDGMMEADEKIHRVYEKMGQPQNYVGKFYPGKHKFDLQMQEDAWSWLEKIL